MRYILAGFRQQLCLHSACRAPYSADISFSNAMLTEHSGSFVESTDVTNNGSTDITLEIPSQPYTRDNGHGSPASQAG
jgi:hypothetical protein